MKFDTRDSPFLAVARSIGDRLIDAAVWERERCGWTGDEIEQVNGRWQVVHRAVGEDLYNGTAGIARFLGHLWRTSRDSRHRATALAALFRAIERSLDSPAPSLWTGATGVACAALELSDVLDDTGVRSSGLRLAKHVADSHILPAPGDPCDLDVISGLAGSLIGFVYIARRAPGAYERHCRAISDRLIAAARTRSVGWSWPMRQGDVDQPHLCGIAHGASGIAVALMEAHGLLGDADLADAAWHAVDYENCWFDSQPLNWPDLRSGGSAVTYSWQWCHGAAGIGMSRLRLHDLTGDSRALADASVALQTVGRSVRPLLSGVPISSLPNDDWNFCVCHGIGSAIEFARYASLVTGERAYVNGARGLAASGIHMIADEREWRCGVPEGGEHPGLMTGIAGIGMGYLALADARCPPVTMWT
jgi:lantibiotic modifying enzyme